MSIVNEMSKFEKEWDETLRKLSNAGYTIEQIEQIKAVCHLFYYVGYDKAITDALNTTAKIGNV
jgi:hypothetical protein